MKSGTRPATAQGARSEWVAGGRGARLGTGSSSLCLAGGDLPGPPLLREREPHLQADLETRGNPQQPWVLPAPLRADRAEGQTVLPHRDLPGWCPYIVSRTLSSWGKGTRQRADVGGSRVTQPVACVLLLLPSPRLWLWQQTGPYPFTDQKGGRRGTGVTLQTKPMAEGQREEATGGGAPPASWTRLLEWDCGSSQAIAPSPLGAWLPR